MIEFGGVHEELTLPRELNTENIFKYKTIRYCCSYILLKDPYFILG